MDAAGSSKKPWEGRRWMLGLPQSQVFTLRAYMGRNASDYQLMTPVMLVSLKCLSFFSHLILVKQTNKKTPNQPDTNSDRFNKCSMSC